MMLKSIMHGYCEVMEKSEGDEVLENVTIVCFACVNEWELLLA